MKIFNEFVTNEGIEDSINWLQGTVCPTYEDVQGCKVGIDTWWGPIAKKIFVEIGAQHICKAIDYTCEFSKATWDCQTCVQDIQAFSNVMTSEAAAQDLVKDLSGPYFCQGNELALDESQVEECQAYVGDFLPKALKALFYLPADDIVKGTCSYYFDICP